jgi:putative spermidine/putrescine transport system substrate-binding protein
MCTPFKAKCGCDIKVETGNADRIAKLVVHAKNPVIDLVLLSDSGMLEAAQKGVISHGLLQAEQLQPCTTWRRIPSAATTPSATPVFGGPGVPQRQDRPADVLEGPVAPRTEGPRGLPRCEHHAGPLMLRMADAAWGGKGGDYATGMPRSSASRTTW